jgi:hypothetical protein
VIHSNVFSSGQTDLERHQGRDAYHLVSSRTRQRAIARAAANAHVEEKVQTKSLITEYGTGREKGAWHREEPSVHVMVVCRATRRVSVRKCAAFGAGGGIADAGEHLPIVTCRRCERRAEAEGQDDPWGKRGVHGNLSVCMEYVDNRRQQRNRGLQAATNILSCW